MRKLYVIGLIAVALLVIGIAIAEEIKFSTYYPAPAGMYREFSTTGRTTLATDEWGIEGDNAMVGIGTTDPQGILHVAGGTATSEDGSPIILQAEDAEDTSLSYDGGNIILLPGKASGDGADGNVGIGTTTPDAKLTVVDGAILASGNIGSTPVSGSGTRLMWIPGKVAFRAGYAFSSMWDDDLIGLGSVAMGFGTRATGRGSTAMGQWMEGGVGPNASGEGSVAMGYGYVEASGTGSVAMGYCTTAQAYASTAFGSYNVGIGTTDSWVATDPILEIGIGTGFNTKANAMTVLKNGNVGIGTTGPSGELHVKGTSGATEVYVESPESQHSYLVFQGDGTGTEYIIGRVDDSDEDVFGIGRKGTDWPFIMDNQGNVGIGLEDPGPVAKLHIYVGWTDAVPGLYIGQGETDEWAQQISTSGYGLFIKGRDATVGVPLLKLQGNNGAIEALYVGSNGNVGIGTVDPGYNLTVSGTAWCTSGLWSGSDIRWKENVETLLNPLEKVLKLRGIRFDWKREEFKGNNFPEGRQIGIIAQELEKEFPQLVTTDGDGYKAIAYDRLTAVLLEAIKAQQRQIETLKREVSMLKRN